MFVRTVKVASSSGVVHEYLRVVESYREAGHVKQRVVLNLGRKDLLADLLPQIARAVGGEVAGAYGELALEPVEALTWGPVLVVRSLFAQLGLWEILDRHLGGSRGVPYADRAFALVANRLIRPKSEHGLGAWLETDLVCDRQGQRFVPRWKRRGRVQVDAAQLQAWYRTLDRLLGAKREIERALYGRLRDLFSLQPDLVLYDLTSSYFEGRGPEGLARHGHSRDGKPRNVQVLVGVVMVGGWPIAHHVFEGNRRDQDTVEEVLADLRERFSFGRIVFVGDRGMVSEANLERVRSEGHGYLVGRQRRRSKEILRWLDQIREGAWTDCPGGIAAREKVHPPRTRVQEVAHGEPGLRVFVIDSDERKAYEQSMRERAMEKTREELEALARRVEAGRLKKPEKIGAAAERILQRRHGYRYYAWEVKNGAFHFYEHPVHLEREKRYEGKYVLETTEKDFTALDAVQLYKQLSDVERGFRDLKDLVGLRPIWHRSDPRVQAHVFVAALALLLDRLLERRLKDGEVALGTGAALEAVQTIRHVTFDLGTETRTGVTPGSPRARQVLKALKIQDRRPPEAPEGMGTAV